LLLVLPKAPQPLALLLVEVVENELQPSFLLELLSLLLVVEVVVAPKLPQPLLLFDDVVVVPKLPHPELELLLLLLFDDVVVLPKLPHPELELLLLLLFDDVVVVPKLPHPELELLLLLLLFDDVVVALKLPHPEVLLLLLIVVEVPKLLQSELEVVVVGVVFNVAFVVFGDMTLHPLLLLLLLVLVVVEEEVFGVITPHPLEPHPLLEVVEVVVVVAVVEEVVFGFMTPHPLEVAVEDLVAEALVGVDQAENELVAVEEEVEDIFKLFFLSLAFLFIISEKLEEALLLRDEVLKDAYLSLEFECVLELREREPKEEIVESIFDGDLAIGLEGAGGAGISHPSST